MTRFALILVCVASLTGCALPHDFGAAASPGVDDATGEGKADDYLSSLGREYDFETLLEVQLSDADLELDDEARASRAQTIASERMSKLTEALDAVIWDRWDKDSRTGDNSLMLRQLSDSIDAPRETEDGAYVFDYLVEAAGPADLFDRFPFDGQDRQRRLLNVEVGEGDDALSYEISVTHSEESTDSYPEYGELMQGGLDIAIHIGDDHRTDDKDIRQARSVYESLVGQFGMRSPVNRFEDLGLESGPFETTMNVEGEAVALRVSLYHADMVEDDELERLLDAYRYSAEHADIVLYEGHAGRSLDYSGVVLHYGPRAAIPASEFRNLVLPNRYQIFVFAGCETYTGYSESLFAHPDKHAGNADVITTVNYSTYRSRATAAIAMLQALTRTYEDTWYPLSWGGVIKHINDYDEGGRWTAMYGVHGLDDNPRISPLADESTIGMSCEDASECPGVDNRCVRRRSGERQCGVACTDDSGCPTGSRCVGVTSGDLGSIRQCLAGSR